jgi:ABC-2 type transport system ATP-binding protein
MAVTEPRFAVEADRLTRRFGSFTAVDRVSFRIPTGTITGFVGANGSGKTTTIRMLCGIISSSSGTARVGGFDINREPDKIKPRIGYMSQKFSLYDDLTVNENIRFFGGIYGMDRKRLAERSAWVLEMAGLRDRADSLTRELAAGWRQRLALGCAVLHEPGIVFLDEPTGSVDPVSRRGFWELINGLAEQGTTLFVTTHYLEEVEYCNQVLLIHAGRIIATGSPEQLKQSHIRNPILEIECRPVIAARELLQRQDWVIETWVFGSYLHVSVTDAESGELCVRRELARAGISPTRVEAIQPSLEDVFIHLIEDQGQRR